MVPFFSLTSNRKEKSMPVKRTVTARVPAKDGQPEKVASITITDGETAEEQEAEEGLDPVWVVGIRRGESRRRSKLFRTEYTRWKVGRHYTRYWFPILNCSERDVRDIIKQHNPPTNPLWRYGFSFECLCLAGMSRRKLDELIVRFPKLALYLAEKDEEVQRYMRRGASYPTPLLDVKVPLHVYVRRRLRENLMIWME